MNRNQYFTVSWFFLALMFFLIWFQANYLTPSLFIGNTLTSSAMYQLTKSAIVSSMIILCPPLFILFQILGWLERSKK